jgi:hypothetical protein
MNDTREDFSGDLIDISGLSLRDVEDLPDLGLVLSLPELMPTDAAARTSQGLSARPKDEYRGHQFVEP